MTSSNAKSLSRRAFIQRTAFAAGALSIPARSWGQVPGANSDIRVAVIGFNGRGKEHLSAWQKVPGVRLTAICDVDKRVLEAEAAQLAKNGKSVETYQDLRKLFESKNVDAVSIATPNHWHALASVWAMQSGRDVYVEKPVSYDVWEGEQMVKAASQYNKIVQAGTQSRSSTGIQEAVEFVNQGHIGKINVARGICYKHRISIGKTDGPQSVPESVDYDLWTGPATYTPPRRRKFHYDWHWFWNYGAGDLGNQGVHEMDVARWFLGEHKVSRRVLSVGGRFGHEDDAETPNTIITYHDYDRAPLIMEVRGLPEKTDSTKMDNYKGAAIGVVIECEGGYVVVPNYDSAKVFNNEGKLVKEFKGATSHFENFIKAVRSRQETDLHCPIREGHYSTALCHLSNISYRLGKFQSPAETRAQLTDEPDGLPTYNRMSEHLAANGINLEKTAAHVGAVLIVNPKEEVIVKNKEANNLLHRTPRTGFVMKVA